MLAFIFGGIGPSEMLVIGVVAVLLFGSKLPSVARSAGKSLTEFKRGMQDLQHEFSSAMSEADRAATTAAEGTQARLSSNPGDSFHDDSLSDHAYDDYECESEVAAAADSDENGESNGDEGSNESQTNSTKAEKAPADA